MKPRSLRVVGTARVAVLGAPTTVGSRLREALADFGVPGKRVDLYGGTRGEVVLSEYAGEARMIQEPDLGEVAGHDVVFICEDSEEAQRIASASRPGAVVIDLLGCLPSNLRPRRVHLDISPGIDREAGGGCFVVPHPLALLLTEMLYPLERKLGLAEVMAVVIRPASDFGEEGLEELREQTVRLLSFSQVPVDTFGRQLAFNIIPQARLATAEPGLEARISAEIAELLGWTGTHATVRLLTAPLFHGHGLQLRFRLKTTADVEQVREALRDAEWFDQPSDAAPATPLEVTGAIRTSLSELSSDGLGGFWLWAVAGETASKGSEQAVRLAARLAEL